MNAESGLAHTVVTAPTNVNDFAQANKLPHDKQTDTFVGAGCRVVVKQEDLGT